MGKRLESDLGYSIKRTCLAKLQRRLQIPSTRRRLPKEMVRDLVEDKIVALQDSSKGAETIRKSLAEEGIKIPRSDVRNCAREVDPLGHARRKRARRAPYTPSNSATPPPAN
ncbi:hypothetical protein PYCCODRAFT_8844 [Trametes coccinea BRFM310]|uniref:Uncharacterized protein n=1 Tax=Trametes coccinea (strain BRFM310) TaxID=1353009 RepID=A0A1Y2J4L8_TRAC3|nr:hypothetical protein PYCCODRAFT_8844 [Trametes coccinea BRFM310]